jgi:hypothetical protein
LGSWLFWAASDISTFYYRIAPHFYLKYHKHRNPWPNSQKTKNFFLKNHSKLPFLAQAIQFIEKKYFFAFLIVRSCHRILGEHVEKDLQKWIFRIGKEKVFSFCPEISCPFFAKKQVSSHQLEWKLCFG